MYIIYIDTNSFPKMLFDSLKNIVDSVYEYFSPVKYVNYNCEVCMKDPAAIPNIGGRFFIVDKYRCQCNGCGTIYKKSEKYAYICM